MCAKVRPAARHQAVSVACPPQHVLSHLLVGPPPNMRLGQPQQQQLGAPGGSSVMPPHLAAALASARGCLKWHQSTPSFLPRPLGHRHCLLRTGTRLPESTRCGGRGARNGTAADGCNASHAMVPASLPVEADEGSFFRVLGAECSSRLLPRRQPLLLLHEAPESEPGEDALEEDHASAATLPAGVASADEAASAAAEVASEATGGEAAASDAAVAADAAADALAEAAAAAADAAAAAAAAAPEADVEAGGGVAEEDDDMIPLEQWKEQQLKQLQEKAITQHLEVPHLTHEGDGAAPVPLPFVRPHAPLKDRFNYLDAVVGAKVLAKADDMKGASNLLNDDRDRYMMTEKDVKKKWVVVSLIENMMLDTIVLANFEYYSCSPRNFQVCAAPLECPRRLAGGLALGARHPPPRARSRRGLPPRARSPRPDETLSQHTHPRRSCPARPPTLPTSPCAGAGLARVPHEAVGLDGRLRGERHALRASELAPA